MKYLQLVKKGAEAPTDIKHTYLCYDMNNESVSLVKYQDPYQYYITYNVTSTTAPTELFKTFGAQAYITSMSIDGGADTTEIPSSGSYTFTTTGEHIVAYKVNQEYNSVIAPLFGNGGGINTIKKVKLGNGLKMIWYYGFFQDANLESVTVGDVTYTDTKSLYAALASNGISAMDSFVQTKLTQNYEVPTISTDEYVDMKLPSGTKWASCNIGATTPTDYGKYFMWGDVEGETVSGTKPTRTYDWANAPFNNGASSYDSAYFTANSGTWLTEKAELKNEYDAAYQATNGEAHMPTREQFVELYNNSIGVFASVNGVNGLVITSMKDQTKTLFIPASGYCYGTSLYNRGTDGDYWSSSLFSSYPLNAYRLNFSSGGVNPQSSNYRCHGYSIRGVVSE